MLDRLFGHTIPRTTTRITQVIPNNLPRIRALITYPTGRTTVPIVGWALVDHGIAQSVTGIAVESAQASVIPATVGQFDQYIEMYEESDL